MIIEEYMEKHFTMQGRCPRGEYAASFGIFIIAQAFAVGLASAVPLLGFVLGCGASGFMIMAACRRSQDCGRSYWFLLIPFYNIWLFFEPGQVGDNRFGPDPRKKVTTGF